MKISEEIHRQRLEDKQREPGVGAEEAKDRTSPLPDLDNLKTKASRFDEVGLQLPDAELGKSMIIQRAVNVCLSVGILRTDF